MLLPGLARLNILRETESYTYHQARGLGGKEKMLSINLTQLYYFHIVALERSMSRAAARLDLTQPTISTHIKALEESIGCGLFERLPRGLELTETGRFVFSKTRRLFAIAEDLDRALLASKTMGEPELRVGITDSVPAALVASLTLASVQKEGGLTLSVVRASGTELQVLLDGSKLDVIFAEDTDGITLGRYSNVRVAENPMLLVGHPKFRETMSTFPKGIDRLPFAALDSSHPIQQELDRALDILGIHLHPFARANDFSLLKSFVTSATCVGFLPLLEVESSLACGELVELGRLTSLTQAVWALFSPTCSRKMLVRALLANAPACQAVPSEGALSPARYA